MKSTVHLGVRLEPGEHARLTALAARHGLSTSDVVRAALSAVHIAPALILQPNTRSANDKSAAVIKAAGASV